MENDFEVDGLLGGDSWWIGCHGGLVEVAVNDDDPFAEVRKLDAQHLRDFARNLERAADYLEGKG